MSPLPPIDPFFPTGGMLLIAAAFLWVIWKVFCWIFRTGTVGATQAILYPPKPEPAKKKKKKGGH